MLTSGTGKTHLATALARQAILQGKRARFFSVVDLGAADKDDVAGAGEIFPGIELAQLRLVYRGFAEVEAIEVARHREAGQAQLIFVGASQAIRRFSLQELGEPGGRGELLVAQCRQALLQRARHPAQSQRLHLLDQLGLHYRSPKDDG